MVFGSSLEKYWLIASKLGLWIPALYLLKKIGYVDHFYYMTAAIDRLHFPRLRSDIHFQGARETDFAEIVQGIGKLDAGSRKEIVTRLLFYRSGLSGCYIGRNDKNDIVSMQWLIRPKENDLLEKHFRGLYYPLKKNQVMIENVFIFPSFRGLGLFPAVNYYVLNLARQEGFETCNAYVRKDNLTSLNAYLDLGFRIRRLLTGYNLVGVSWRTL